MIFNAGHNTWIEESLETIMRRLRSNNGLLVEGDPITQAIQDVRLSNVYRALDGTAGSRGEAESAILRIYGATIKAYASGSSWVYATRATSQPLSVTAEIAGPLGLRFLAFDSEPSATVRDRHGLVRMRLYGEYHFVSSFNATVDGLDVQAYGRLLIARPTAEHMVGVSSGMAPFVMQAYSAPAQGSRWLPLLVDDEMNPTRSNNLPRADVGANAQPPTGWMTPQEMISAGRDAYRAWLRLASGRSVDVEQAAEAAAQAARREQAAQRYASFAARSATTDRHVPTLPFIPSGYSSSRRWGIEVESGGARNVETPDGWEREYDGSLRSAYDGYVEVQDFEPYDEEVTSFRRPSYCTNDHTYERRNPATRAYELNPDYVPVEDCQGCGNVTEIVHRTPQTIHHVPQGDDCAEFVSPILVSMHSDGLRYLCEAIAPQPQNSTSGIHVHVEASDLTNKQVAALIFGYDVLEPLLEASYQRESRRYCARRDPATVLQAARMANSPEAPSSSEVRSGTRYVTLNTTALNEHGTIEFRAMGPVYDYEYLVRWAMLCRELVNMAAAGVTIAQFSKISTWDALLGMLAEYGREYPRALVYERTQVVEPAPDLLKEEGEQRQASASPSWESEQGAVRIGWDAATFENWMSGITSLSGAAIFSSSEIERMSQAWDRLVTRPASLVTR